MEKRYDKLVRDNIPDIIRSQGNVPVCRTLSEGEYLEYLDGKLREETEEYISDHDVRELCDILEVIKAIAAELSVSGGELENMRKAKAGKNGAFKNKMPSGFALTALFPWLTIFYA